MTKALVFRSDKVPASLSPVYLPRKLLPIDAVTVVATRAPIEKGKTPFQPVTTTVLPSDKDPASLSSISVLRKPSPVTTDYIHPIFEINGGCVFNAMCGGVNTYKVLANKCLDLDKSFHTFFFGNRSVICYELLRVSNFIHMLHTFANTLFIFLCSGTTKLTYYQRFHMNK